MTIFTAFTLYHNGQVENHTNTIFDNVCEINNIDDFTSMIHFDHMVSKCVDNKRKKENFVEANCLFFDIDNDGDPKSEWDDFNTHATIDTINKVFGDYEYLLTYSRSHQKDKGDRAARNKYHLYFPLGTVIKDATNYEDSVKLVMSSFTRPDGVEYFDPACKETSRLFYGPKTLEGIFHNPGKSLIDYIGALSFRAQMSGKAPTMMSKSTPQLSEKDKEDLFKAKPEYSKLIEPAGKEYFYNQFSLPENSSGSTWRVDCPLHDNNSKGTLVIFKNTLNFECKSGRCAKHGTAIDFKALNEDKTRDQIMIECSEWLDIDSLDEVLLTSTERVVQEMNSKYAMITDEAQASVLMESTQAGRVGVIRKPWSQVKIVERKRTMIGDDSHLNIDMWHNSEDRRDYASLTFDPTQKEVPKNGENWNMWFRFSDPELKGFLQFIDIDQYNTLDLETAKKSCKLYIELIRDVICGGSPDHEENARLFKYIMFWLASAVTQPARKPMTAIVLTSGQGCGKGTFVENLLKLYGEYGTKVESSGELTSNFNWRFKNNLLTFVDEALYAGDHRHKNLMKNLISSKTRSLEGKGVDTITVPNYSRYIYASNENHVVNIDSDDRRHVVVSLSHHRQKDGAYFQAIENEWDNGGMEAFLYLMINEWSQMEEFKTFHFEKEIVYTKAKREQELASNPLRQWWEHRLDNGCFTHKDEQGEFHKIKIFDDNLNTYIGIETDCIYSDYVKWQKDIGGGYRMAKNQFSSNFKKLDVGFDSLPRQRDSDGTMAAVWQIDTKITE